MCLYILVFGVFTLKTNEHFHLQSDSSACCAATTQATSFIQHIFAQAASCRAVEVLQINVAYEGSNTTVHVNKHQGAKRISEPGSRAANGKKICSEAFLYFAFNTYSQCVCFSLLVHYD